MKKQLLLFALLLITSLGYAQKTLSKDYTYTVSSPYKVFDAQHKLYFYKDNEILTVKVDGKEIMLQKFDNGEKIKFKSQKLYENVFPKHYQAEGVVEFNDKFYFFYSSWDGDNDKEQLYVREIDFKKGEFVGENKLMFKVDGKIAGSMGSGVSFGGPFISMGTVDKFDFLVSSDKRKMLIQYRKKPKVKRDVKSWDIIGVHAYEGDLEAKYNNELKMPYTERRMDVLDYTIDRQANAYILAKVYHDDSNDDKKRRRDTEANYHMELFRIPAGTDKFDITKIEVKDKFVNGMSIFEGPGDYMVCAGFYNNGKNAKSADGMMVFKVKRDGDIYDKSFNEIPLEIVNQNLSAKQKRKNEKKEKKKEEEGEGEGAEIRAFTMDKVVVENDGSIVLLGEQYYTVTHYSQKHTYTSYHYEDILITKIDPSGKMSWIKKLPKKQAGLNGQGGMSYKHFFVNDIHYVLYLDNVKNFNLPDDKRPAVHSDGKGGYFTSYKIDDATGEAKSGSVFDMRNVDDMTMYQFSVGRIIEISKDEFAIEFYKKKKEDVMMKVKMQ
ncbi:MAG: hypothetical protein ACO1N9_13265 [Flavobacterium sp.]